eukprot:TRINITY_DN7279_c0_g1_i1.p1 TRINITY_DN7279_c0_g1~~TRINITY_DN7279_c0_g1_i1.p1  ORF type:complete len:221 (+),score=36.14 TRINITY_DN7279_c0_g1_i1:421-1083(+)
MGISPDGKGMDILHEYMTAGSVRSILDRFHCLDEVVMRRYIRQILEGLKYLHLQEIIHKNLKCSNVLLDNNACIKLADFGSIRKIALIGTAPCNRNDLPKLLKGSSHWAAPEVVQSLKVREASDIWSVGCIMIEMRTGKPPWANIEDEQEVLQAISETTAGPELPVNKFSEPALDFLKKCLRVDPSERPTANELLNHEFLLFRDSSMNSSDVISDKMQGS